MREIFPHVYEKYGKLYTKALSPVPVYGEKFIEYNGELYREWDVYRSKLAAAIKKGLKRFPITSRSAVLYLGASTGTTVSHVSDIAKDGIIFAVEISAKMMHSLLKVAEERKNIVPILADARHVEEYKDIGSVDVLYQDVAQRDQTDILIKNAKAFLKPKGYAMYCIKSQSIDVKREAKEIFEEEISKLEKHFDILERIRLEPYDKQHLFLLMRKK